MGRIQRPRNYRSPAQKVLDQVVVCVQEVKALGSPRDWFRESLGVVIVMTALLVIYCLLP